MKKYINSAVMLLATFVLVACGQSYEKLIIGRWHSEMEVVIPDSNGQQNITRKNINVSEYFSNGSSSMSSRVVVKVVDAAATNKWKEFEYTYETTFSREWKVDGKELLIKIVDVKSRPLILKFDGKIIEDKEQANKIWSGIKMPEDVIPKGQTSKLKIISLDKLKFVWEGDLNGSGKMQTISSEKTDKVLRDFVD